MSAHARKGYASVATTIGFFLVVSMFIPAIPHATASDGNPWGFQGGWEFVWEIGESPFPLESGSKLSLIITDISQDSHGNWRLLGNLSRYTDLGLGETRWYEIAGDVVVARYEPATNLYVMNSIASSKYIIILPVALDDPFFTFALDYDAFPVENWTRVVNESARTITYTNKSSPSEQVFFHFNDQGVVDNVTRTTGTGDVSYRMWLVQSRNAMSDLEAFLAGAGMVSIGALITVLIYFVTRKKRDQEMEPVDENAGEEGDNAAPGTARDSLEAGP